MAEKTRFWQSYGNIDIWFVENKDTGTTKYMFWWQGQSYERDGEAEILALAKGLTEAQLKKNQNDKVGGKQR